MSYEAYRRNKIESGLLYQDFVVDLCFQTIGLVIVQYSSRFYQTQVGESRTGVEIKHDELYAETGYLWIEIAEKARPRHGDYVPSGIRRDDNSWLYVIGNYDTVFILPKHYLCALHDAKRYRELENKTRTSKGFLLPDEHARRYAAYVLRPKAEQKVAQSISDLQALGRELHQLATTNTAQASLWSG